MHRPEIKEVLRYSQDRIMVTSEGADIELDGMYYFDNIDEDGTKVGAYSMMGMHGELGNFYLPIDVIVGEIELKDVRWSPNINGDELATIHAFFEANGYTNFMDGINVHNFTPDMIVEKSYAILGTYEHKIIMEKIKESEE